MHKPVYVYSHDSNPDCDPPKYPISRQEAVERLARGYVRFVSANQVQLKPPPGWVAEMPVNYVSVNDAWEPRYSDHFLVLQLRTPTLSDQ